VSMLARPISPAATFASLRQLGRVAGRRLRFGAAQMVIVDRGGDRGQLQEDIARRLSHVTGWGVTRLGAAELGPGEVAGTPHRGVGRPPPGPGRRP
jgi:hypothetical protein